MYHARGRHYGRYAFQLLMPRSFKMRTGFVPLAEGISLFAAYLATISSRIAEAFSFSIAAAF